MRDTDLASVVVDCPVAGCTNTFALPVRLSPPDFTDHLPDRLPVTMEVRVSADVGVLDLHLKERHSLIYHGQGLADPS